MEKEIAQLKEKLASGSGRDMAAEALTIGNGVKLVAVSVEGADAAALRTAVDQLKNKLGSAAVVLGSVAADGKVLLIAGVTADLTGKVRAGDLVNHVALQVGGKGGGRADLAQAGGTDPSRLEAALESVGDWLRERLG
jgi:alanyl-tRNA synthetase